MDSSFHPYIYQVQRFIIVGIMATVLNYGLFFLLFKFLSIHYIVASVVGYSAGLLFGFFFNRSWTFRSLETRLRREAFSYVGIYLASLILSMFFLQFLVVMVQLQPVLANVFAIGLSTVINFLGCKLFVFKRTNA